ncbi:S-adenosyl-l-methionine hydroxide adenosyltransferase family protein [Geitlerinema sp. PCC 7407]|uniref:SAM hydrolase/SAM-dependent halogenase family protein n=1 Tax=Geitlerinema sp. PCC 7407 TaxID=1173025 RepID=UPI00029FB6AF|nr:SAM-dependent chlorinase/fluorinase [Geitlerinema sp. PCC 7407]AFY66805.1 protein of unknown function DUF62 [Geitlerinema sp. PCC 7407]
MTANRILTLLTDFGLTDVYVGVMKGAIAAINRDIQVIDLTHDIAPQDVAAARFNLMNAYSYFPAGTVHVAVVDPGVGSQRRGVAVAFDGGWLVGPDNGLLSGVLSQRPAIAAVALTNPDYWRSPVASATFHGRDIFAPVGAHLASGVPLSALGCPVDPATLSALALAPYHVTDTGLEGCIQHIDRFGNLITNIPNDQVKDRTWAIALGRLRIPGCTTYSDIELQQPLALPGSHGWVEVAVNGGDAHFQLRLNWGDRIQIVLQ